MSTGAGTAPAGTVNLYNGDGHSEASGSLRVCTNPDCDQHTPRETCPRCERKTVPWPPPRPAA